MSGCSIFFHLLHPRAHLGVPLRCTLLPGIERQADVALTECSGEAHEMGEVIECLGVGFVEILPFGFVFDDKGSFPEKIY